MPRAINPAALREIRTLVGLSQRELARRCEISETTITNIEREKHGVSPALMRKLADQLGVAIDAITSVTPAPETADAK
jgi:transcriptional regulator with XRE-family HTH domain